MFVCAGKKESFSFAKPIGLGLINSAIKLTKICLEKKPKELVFIGTAGSYGNVSIGEIIQSNISANVEIGYLKQKSYTPLKDYIVSRETITNKIVNSSNFITADINIAKDFLNLGYDLENMEFFAVQQVAKHFSINSYGIFYVTNYCDKNAHNDFLKNHAKAKLSLEKQIIKYTVKNPFKNECS